MDKYNIHKRTYIYETHMHTSECSACASGTGAEMARAHAAAGYAGIIITDHFFNGNTAVNRHLPWEERVELFCKGYENALEEGKRIGLHVFLGWEYAYDGTEFLTYGLDKEFLLAHPDMLSWSLEKYLKKAREAGGLIVHAHPFRETYYIPEIRIYPKDVDAVEVINTSHHDPKFNKRAMEYADEHSLLKTSGSDTHHTHSLSGGGMEFDYEITSIEEFIQAVKNPDCYRLMG